MNSLSWFIYFAGMVDKLAMFLGFIAIVFFVAFLLSLFLYFLSFAPGADDEYKWATKWLKRVGYVLAAVGVVFGIIANVLPPSQTMLLIAASEAGGTAFQSPDGQEIYGLVKSKIEDMLAPEKK